MPARQLIEADATDTRLVQGPVRPNVNTMLGSFLQVETHTASKYAEQRRVSESLENSAHRGKGQEALVEEVDSTYGEKE